MAREFVEDLAADGVIYGEARWAPEQHTRAGLTKAQAVEAVRDGLAEGRAAVVATVGTSSSASWSPPCGTPEPTTEIAELAVRYRDDGVAGFDIAGAEKGFPPERFLDSFQLLQAGTTRSTRSTPARPTASTRSGRPCWLCGPTGSATACAIIDDMTIDADGSATLGDFAAYVRDQQITLEMCPSSNVQTGGRRRRSPSIPSAGWMHSASG